MEAWKVLAGSNPVTGTQARLEKGTALTIMIVLLMGTTELLTWRRRPEKRVLEGPPLPVQTKGFIVGFFDDVEEIIEDVAIAEAVSQPRRRHGYGSGAGLGVNIQNGDLVENLGDGIGIDLNTGQIDLEIGNTGLDIGF